MVDLTNLPAVPTLFGDLHFVVRIASANMDYMQAGPGINSCGPGSLAQYLIDPTETGSTIRLNPFSWNTASPMDISREAASQCNLKGRQSLRRRMLVEVFND
jgi:hypothetical protein